MNLDSAVQTRNIGKSVFYEVHFPIFRKINYNVSLCLPAIKQIDWIR